ncbi:MAG: hypothetical protein M3P24_02235, partial [Gemmatimonadota bacterium]|nr:hypothetical protein [Gemmatimonadota bacterium]
MIRLLAGPHPPEGDLVRLLDRQVDIRTRRRLQGHLGRCPLCTLKLEGMERKSQDVARALGALPVQLPETGRRALALSAMERASRRRVRAPLSGRSWM